MRILLSADCVPCAISSYSVTLTLKLSRVYVLVVGDVRSPLRTFIGHLHVKKHTHPNEDRKCVLMAPTLTLTMKMRRIYYYVPEVYTPWHSVHLNSFCSGLYALHFTLCCNLHHIWREKRFKQMLRQWLLHADFLSVHDSMSVSCMLLPL